MIVAHGEDGQIRLTRLDVDAKHPLDLLTASVASPSCTPDGKFVFYASVQQPQEIWRIPMDGGTPVEIAAILGDQLAGPVLVSPDGKHIAYVYTKFAESQGWYIAVIFSGGAPEKLLPWQSDSWTLSWSPDGKGFYYLATPDGVTNLWEQPLSSAKPKQLTAFSSGLIFGFNCSFDRKRLLLTRGEVESDAILLSNSY
jgi:Tol biopolymer transport system component